MRPFKSSTARVTMPSAGKHRPFSGGTRTGGTLAPTGAYPERILLPRDHRMSAQPSEDAEEATDAPVIVYPNPAKDQQAVYVVTKLLEGMEQGTLQVYDPLGRLLHTQRIASATAIVEVPVKGLSPGLYLVTLDGEGLRIGTSKFELTR